MLNTEYRLYDPRLAQWLTRDPVFQPWESPYSAMAGNPILFSDPQGDTPGTGTQTQNETDFSGGGQKDKIVNYGPPNEKVDKYAKILAKHTSETPAYSQPDISICEPVKLVFRGNFLTVDKYDVVTKDGIVGSIGIGEFRWGERFALFHAERPEGVEVLQQIETGFNYNGIIITRQYSEADLLAHEPPVPSCLPSSSNQARINQPGQYNGKIPKSSAKKASPPPAAKQKTDQVAGSETLDDALRGTEQPFGGSANTTTQLTKHGAERIAGAAATRGGVLSIEEVGAIRSLIKEPIIQADGAKVFIHQISPGRYSGFIENQNTGKLITTMNNWSKKSINKMGKNHGWSIE